MIKTTHTRVNSKRNHTGLPVESSRFHVLLVPCAKFRSEKGFAWLSFLNVLKSLSIT